MYVYMAPHSKVKSIPEVLIQEFKYGCRDDSPDDTTINA
jgi:hypothetical protein